MTTSLAAKPEAAARPRGPRPADDRRRRGRRAQGRAGDPHLRTDRDHRSRGSATTRCSSRSAPAGSAWSRSRWAAGRCPSRRPLHADGRRRHGRQDPAHLAGGREGAAREPGVPAAQPPAGLPDLRQGRRVPAAEPDDGNGPPDSRFVDAKRVFAKPIAMSTRDPAGPRALRAVPALHPVLRPDRRRQVHRPARTRLRAADRDQRRTSRSSRYFSGNTIQICPVGALTCAAYRFRSRPFDLVSTPSVCEHCACGCALRTDTRRGAVLRRLAGNDPEVNEEWNCDKGRFAFRYLTSAGPDHPADGPRQPTACWPRRRGPTRCRWPPRACSPRARAGSACWPAGGSPSKTPTPTPSSPGSRPAPTTSTSGPARTRAEELDFLAAHVVGNGPERLSYTRLEAAPAVLLRGAGAGGGGAGRLPAAAQGRAEAPAEGLPPRPVDHPGRAADGGRAGLVGAGRPGRADPRGARSRGRGARPSWRTSPRTWSRP